MTVSQETYRSGRLAGIADFSHAGTARTRAIRHDRRVHVVTGARREITRTFWARVHASGATAFTAPVIVDRYGPDRGRSDPRSRDHEPRPSADQADGLMTDASQLHEGVNHAVCREAAGAPGRVL